MTGYTIAATLKPAIPNNANSLVCSVSLRSGTDVEMSRLLWVCNILFRAKCITNHECPSARAESTLTEGQPPGLLSPFSSCYRVVLHRWPSMAASGPQEIKLFGKWSYDDVEVSSRATRLTACQAVGRQRNFAKSVAFIGERHLAGRLHCRKVKECSLRTAHSWTVSEKEVQESTVPHR